MKRRSYMIIAGDPSGDLLAAELVTSLAQASARVPADRAAGQQPLETSLAPVFFGAGGPRMQAAGVDLAFDLTRHALIGISDVFRKYLQFRRLFHQLLRLAIDRQPDVIICVDFSGFNRRFAAAVRHHVRARHDWFHPWNPKIIQYVSPQVWASRESRVHQVARDFDLLLSTIPFEKDWYAARAPRLKVEFVGHPVVDRYAGIQPLVRPESAPPRVVLLPGSRAGELQRHLPLVKEAARRIAAAIPAQFVMVLPREDLIEQAKTAGGDFPGMIYQAGDLPSALSGASLALTKSGTVTLECALFGVPSVVFYKTSAINYAIGRRIIKVKYIAMPNLLADDAVFPELIQEKASAETIAAAGLAFLKDPSPRAALRARLAQIVGNLGNPGASHRAAAAILAETAGQ